MSGDGKAIAFVRKVVGLPWQKDANGPEAYSCRGLTRAALREIFDRALLLLNETDGGAILGAMATVAKGGAHGGWHEVARPQHGDLMTLRHEREPQHIGIFLALNRGGLLHSFEGGGVCFDPLAVLPMSGWGRFRFYRFCEDSVPPVAAMEAA